MVEKGLKTAHNQASASHIQQMGLVLDHLVDALGGGPKLHAPACHNFGGY